MPLYRKVALEASRLRALDLTFDTIAVHLGVSKTTVMKALAAIRN